MANGLLDTATLTPVRSQPHLRLTAAAEASLAAVRATILALFGWVLVLTDAYRTYAEQERIFRQRYTTTYLPGRPSKVWQGRRWYLRAGYAAAAVPGTSNHGTGIAVDVANLGGFAGVRYRQFASVAEPAGWSNAEGKAINEAWHWNHLRGGTPVTNPIGGGGGSVPGVAPTPPTPAAPAAPALGPASWEDDNAMDYLIALYLNLTGRKPDPLGAITHLSAIAKGEKTWPQIAADIEGGPESKAFAALGSEATRNDLRLTNSKGWI